MISVDRIRVFESISLQCSQDYDAIVNTYNKKQLEYITRDLHNSKPVGLKIANGDYSQRAYQVIFDYAWKKLDYEPEILFL